MGNSKFTSSLSKGISYLCLWECFLAVDLELVLEEEEGDGEEGGDGGGLGGSSPYSLLSFEDSPRIGLFQCKKSSYRTFTISNIARKFFQNSISS
jgi:hypothetical protein